MNTQPFADEPERDLPDSNTLGGTSSTGAGPDGDQTDTPAPETPGLGHDDLGKLDETAERLAHRPD